MDEKQCGGHVDLKPTPVGDAGVLETSEHLAKANDRQLMVPRHRRSTFGRRTFSAAGPMEVNLLPADSLRDTARSTDGFRSALKTRFFLRRKGTFSALEALLDALYKSTTTRPTTNSNN